MYNSIIKVRTRISHADSRNLKIKNSLINLLLKLLELKTKTKYKQIGTRQRRTVKQKMKKRDKTKNHVLHIL